MGALEFFAAARSAPPVGDDDAVTLVRPPLRLDPPGGGREDTLEVRSAIWVEQHGQWARTAPVAGREQHTGRQLAGTNAGQPHVRGDDGPLGQRGDRAGHLPVAQDAERGSGALEVASGKDGRAPRPPRRFHAGAARADLLDAAPGGPVEDERRRGILEPRSGEQHDIGVDADDATSPRARRRHDLLTGDERLHPPSGRHPDDGAVAEAPRNPLDDVDPLRVGVLPHEARRPRGRIHLEQPDPPLVAALDDKEKAVVTTSSPPPRTRRHPGPISPALTGRCQPGRPPPRGRGTISRVTSAFGVPADG